MCQELFETDAYRHAMLGEIARAASPQSSVAATALLALSEASPEETRVLQEFEFARASDTLADFFRGRDADVLITLSRKLRSSMTYAPIARRLLHDLARHQEEQPC